MRQQSVSIDGDHVRGSTPSKDVELLPQNGKTQFRIFFDFDNTLTSFDVLDAIIEQFSPDERWRACERAWQDGLIGSRECLDEQVRLLRVGRGALVRYLSAIRIDPAFKPILKLCAAHKSAPVIVSDSFSFFIKTILAANSIRNIPVYANRLRFKGNTLTPVFSYTNRTCDTVCAHCKKNTLLGRVKSDTISIYVGDGLSDVCASLEADIVFAKESLARQLARRKKPYIPFVDLRSVYTDLSEVFHGRATKDKQKNKECVGKRPVGA